MLPRKDILGCKTMEMMFGSGALKSAEWSKYLHILTFEGKSHHNICDGFFCLRIHILLFREL